MPWRRAHWAVGRQCCARTVGVPGAGGGGSGRADPLSAISWREGREQGDLLAQP